MTDSTALVPYQGRPTDVVQSIMKQVVADRSRHKYINENILMMIWLFDSELLREAVLFDWAVERMIRADERDQESSKTKRTYLRSECRALLLDVNKDDKNSPIILDKLTFNIFSHYLTTRTKADGTTLSRSSYGGIRSALVYLHRMNGTEMDIDMQKDLSQLMSGMKRKVAKDKIASGKPLDEGKRPMSFEAYHLMCEKLNESDHSEAIFAHCFLTLEWNLMARSDNCISMHVSHVEWRQDCLVFFFGKTKGDQAGEKAAEPWHVYSNPDDPVICPVLALAKYMFAYPDLVKENGQIFPGTEQYNRFIKIFHRVIEQNEDEFLSIGVKAHMLGSHSCRKGAITLVSTGCTVSPPMASICLRACWTMGPVKDRYIHYEKAGDQFTGRTVTGISSLQKEFAVSPVYWDWSGCEASASDAVDAILAETCVAKHETSPQTFALLSMLFASLCFHHRYLDTTLASNSALRGSAVFAAVGTFEHSDKATTAYPWTATRFTPKFTGIPPHVVILVKMEELKLEMKQQTAVIVEKLKMELDERSIGGADYRATQILQEVKELVQKIAVPQTERQPFEFGDTFNVGDDWDVEDDDNMVTNYETGGGTVAGISNNNSTTARRHCNDRLMVLIGRNGKLSLLPKEYVFPTMSFPNFVVMWYCGDRSKNVAPLRLLKAADVQQMKRGKQTLSMMKKLIGHVKRAAAMANLRHLVVRNWTPESAMTLYNSVKHFFRFPLSSYQKRQRFESLSWKTYYNTLAKRKGKLLGEIPVENAAPRTTTQTMRTMTTTPMTARKRATRGGVPAVQPSRPRKRWQQQQQEEQSDFVQTFASLKPAAPDATSIIPPPTECSLGDQCTNQHITGTRNARGVAVRFIICVP